MVPKALLSHYSSEEDLDKETSLEYEGPSANLFKFEGLMQSPLLGNPTQLDISNLLLRGCSLKNVDHVYGLVIYTGHDSKIMMNSVKAKTKLSKLEKKMNK